MRIKLLISYDGTDYAGWQRQSEDAVDPRPTIQKTLEDAVSKIFNKEVKVQASGRTDAGVHAEGQVVHFDAPKDPSNMNLLRSLNAMTPPTLGILRAWVAPEEFHALASATRKTYFYRIHNSPIPNPLTARFSTWIKKPLDIQKLNGLTECLIGEHDFKSFQTSGSSVKTTNRTIFAAHWSLDAKAQQIVFQITGSGFLRQMVRNIVGAALYLHQNDGTPLDMQKILVAKDRQIAKGTAPGEGLHLVSVEYPPDLDNRCRDL